MLFVQPAGLRFGLLLLLLFLVFFIFFLVFLFFFLIVSDPFLLLLLLFQLDERFLQILARIGVIGIQLQRFFSMRRCFPCNFFCLIIATPWL